MNHTWRLRGADDDDDDTWLAFLAEAGPKFSDLGRKEGWVGEHQFTRGRYVVDIAVVSGLDCYASLGKRVYTAAARNAVIWLQTLISYIARHDANHYATESPPLNGEGKANWHLIYTTSILGITLKKFNRFA